MIQGKWIRWLLNAVASLNLLVLFMFFIFPRVQFMMANGALTPDRLKESRGAPDMPNLFYDSYKMLNRIKRETPEHAMIFFPALGEGEHHSPAIQTLYPRRIFWEGSSGYADELDNLKHSSEAFRVIGEGEEFAFCREPVMDLKAGGYRMCRVMIAD